MAAGGLGAQRPPSGRAKPATKTAEFQRQANLYDPAVMRHAPAEAADVRDYVEELWDGLSGEALWTLNHLSITDEFGTLADIERFLAEYPGKAKAARAAAKAYVALALAGVNTGSKLA